VLRRYAQQMSKMRKYIGGVQIKMNSAQLYEVCRAIDGGVLRAIDEGAQKNMMGKTLITMSVLKELEYCHSKTKI
jgi:hypothetical protein